MGNLLETNVTFHEDDYYTSFDFEQWLSESPNQMRMVFADFDGGVEEKAECNLTLDEWEYLAKRILEAVALGRKQIASKDYDAPIPADMPIEPAPYENKDYGYLRLLDAMLRFNNDRKKAAEFLGISERTLYRKLAEYDLLKK